MEQMAAAVSLEYRSHAIGNPGIMGQDALEEAARRARRRKALVQDVLPDLRGRLAPARGHESESRCKERSRRPTPRRRHRSRPGITR
jgi:hypothetical protein